MIILLTQFGLQSIQREKQELQETIHKQQKTIVELQGESTQKGRRTNVEWKRFEANQKVFIFFKYATDILSGNISILYVTYYEKMDHYFGIIEILIWIDSPFFVEYNGESFKRK